MKIKKKIKLRPKKKLQLRSKIKIHTKNTAQLHHAEALKSNVSQYWIDIVREMKESFLTYALSVITDRALPDIRDGLKPVHRRILWSMKNENITSSGSTKKSARIVGSTMGMLHPHGDQAIYMTLVRMAQDFSMRYPLIIGQGNFGSIDGDPPAAMRYTEAKLSKFADKVVLADMNPAFIPMQENYDDTWHEPIAIPTRAPLLLINGSEGIAVGMATKIAPHNLIEIMNALIFMVDNENPSLKKIMRIVKAPDFPTGGYVIATRTELKKLYRYGIGAVTIRAKTSIDDKGKIIITELPYQVNKAKLLEKIASLVKDKKLAIRAIRDESDRHGMRIVIEPKKGYNPDALLNNLYKKTNLQKRYSIHMVTLINNQPKTLGLIEILRNFIYFRRRIVYRRTTWLLKQAEDERHILIGLLLALANIDKVIKIIKKSKSSVLAQAELMKHFELSERQAKAILDMRLSKLTSLEVHKLEERKAELDKLIEYYNQILTDDETMKDVLKKEFQNIINEFGDERRSIISRGDANLSDKDLVPNKKVVLIRTAKNYLQIIPANDLKASRRGAKGMKGIKLDNDDLVLDFLSCNMHDQLLAILRDGRAYVVDVYKLPITGLTSKGRFIGNFIPFKNPEDSKQIFKLLTLKKEETKYLALISEQGYAKRLDVESLIRLNGTRLINVADDDKLVDAITLSDDEGEFMVASAGGKINRFDIDAIRVMGRQARGTSTIKLAKGDKVVSLLYVNPQEREKNKVILVTEKGFCKINPVSSFRVTSRRTKGVTYYKPNEKTGPVIFIQLGSKQDEISVLTINKKIVKIAVQDLNVQAGRTARGNRLVRNTVKYATLIS